MWHWLWPIKPCLYEFVPFFLTHCSLDLPSTLSDYHIVICNKHIFTRKWKLSYDLLCLINPTMKESSPLLPPKCYLHFSVILLVKFPENSRYIFIIHYHLPSYSLHIFSAVMLMTNSTLSYFFRFILYNHATGGFLLLQRACYHYYVWNSLNTLTWIYIIAATVGNSGTGLDIFTYFLPPEALNLRTFPAIALHSQSTLQFDN